MFPDSSHCHPLIEFLSVGAAMLIQRQSSRPPALVQHQLREARLTRESQGEARHLPSSACEVDDGTQSETEKDDVQESPKL
jgi:hypothetical protein